MSGLKFYPASHRYKLDGEFVPGVTTILGVLDKPAIPKWAAKTIAEYVADNPNGVEELRRLGRGPMVAALKEMPWQRRDDAGVRGNILHDYAEALLKGEEVEVADEHVTVMESALAFIADWRIEPILIEFPCASREHKWAGTGDLIARYTHPVTGHRGVGIFDWKSGKGIYGEYALQMSAYAHAEFYIDGEGNENPIPKCDAAFGVHIRADGYDVYPMAFGADVYSEFLDVRRVFEMAKRMRGDWKTPGSGYVGMAVQADGAA